MTMLDGAQVEVELGEQVNVNLVGIVGPQGPVGPMGPAGAAAPWTLPASNGTDDTANIQGAINTLSARLAGTNAIGVIVGDAGSTYQLPSLSVNTVTVAGLPANPVQCALVLRSNVLLQGCNFNVQGIQPPNTVFLAAIGIADGTVLCGVDHCSFNGNATGPQSTEYQHEAIMAGCANDVWITNNRCQNFYQSFLLTIGYPAGSTFPARWWVLNNRVTRCQGGAIKLNAGVSDVVVAGNELGPTLSFPTWGAEQISFNDAHYNNTRVLISGNTVKDAGNISLASGQEIQIVNNTVLWTSATALTGAGIVIPLYRNVLIAGNYLDLSQVSVANGNGAIHCWNPGSTNICNGLSVVNNTCIINAQNTAGCIYVRGTAGGIPSNVICKGNQCYGGSQTGLVSNGAITVIQFDDIDISDNVIVCDPSVGAYAIYGQTQTLGRIAGNVIYNGGITVQAVGGANDITSWVISGNSMYTTFSATGAIICSCRCVVTANSMYAAAAGTSVGIRAATTFSCTIVGNNIKTQGNPCITENTTATTGRHLIANNNLANTAGATVTLAAASSAIVRHNVGYNPIGNLTVTVPASGTAIAADARDRIFYVTGGTGGVTLAMSTGGTITIPAATCVPVSVPAQSVFTPTYTSAPTWVVQGS
jgi:hypothetical protein